MLRPERGERREGATRCSKRPRGERATAAQQKRCRRRNQPERAAGRESGGWLAGEGEREAGKDRSGGGRAPNRIANPLTAVPRRFRDEGISAAQRAQSGRITREGKHNPLRLLGLLLSPLCSGGPAIYRTRAHLPPTSTLSSPYCGALLLPNPGRLQFPGDRSVIRARPAFDSAAAAAWPPFPRVADRRG